MHRRNLNASQKRGNAEISNSGCDYDTYEEGSAGGMILSTEAGNKAGNNNHHLNHTSTISSVVMGSFDVDVDMSNNDNNPSHGHQSSSAGSSYEETIHRSSDHPMTTLWMPKLIGLKCCCHDH